jgi:predicted nucleic acid-binding protein
MRVVLDAGPLIHLSWIDRLDLLHSVFADIVVPIAVRDEVLAAPAGTLGLQSIQAAFAEPWLRVESPGPASVALSASEQRLGHGEREAIRLADWISADLLLTDDAPARRLAQERGIRVSGTLGVLRMARQRGLIPAALPLLLELRRLGQWIGYDLLDRVAREEIELR